MLQTEAFQQPAGRLCSEEHAAAEAEAAGARRPRGQVAPRRSSREHYASSPAEALLRLSHPAAVLAFYERRDDEMVQLGRRLPRLCEP